MSTTTAAKRTEQSNARDKRCSERSKTRLLLENQSTTQATQVAAPQETIPVTVATRVPFWTSNPSIRGHVPPGQSRGTLEDLWDLFEKRAFYTENLDYIQREFTAIDIEIEQLLNRNRRCR